MRALFHRTAAEIRVGNDVYIHSRPPTGQMLLGFPVRPNWPSCLAISRNQPLITHLQAVAAATRRRLGDKRQMLHIQTPLRRRSTPIHQLNTMLLFTYIHALRRAQCSRVPPAETLHFLVHPVWTPSVALNAFHGISFPRHTCSRNAPTTYGDERQLLPVTHPTAVAPTLHRSCVIHAPCPTFLKYKPPR